ncbi:SAP domain-containing protein [Candidatus Woesearchaeota archaeon]|nr:SAP domain-containing protein [Candidatus Woesearchaeota archaeon]
MNIREIKSKAKRLGVDTKKVKKKADVIKEIQRKEGNFDCFGTAYDYCDQLNCSWRSDCLKN